MADGALVAEVYVEVMGQLSQAKNEGKKKSPPNQDQL